MLGRQRAATATCAARCSRARPEVLAMRVAHCGPGVSAPHMHCGNSCDVLRCVALLDQDFNIYIFFRYLFATHNVTFQCNRPVPWLWDETQLAGPSLNAAEASLALLSSALTPAKPDMYQ